MTFTRITKSARFGTNEANEIPLRSYFGPQKGKEITILTLPNNHDDLKKLKKGSFFWIQIRCGLTSILFSNNRFRVTKKRKIRMDDYTNVFLEKAP